MQIWVDADACPHVIRQILYRAAKRAGVTVTLVANRDIRVPASPHIRSIRVRQGFDVADREILERTEAGDLVVTADIPLAADVIDKGGLALDPRGTLYDEENVRERLAVRDLMDQLRSTGVETGGPASFSMKDRQAFANQLDRVLTRHANRTDS